METKIPIKSMAHNNMKRFSAWSGLSPKSIALMKSLYELNLHNVRREIHLGYRHEMNQMDHHTTKKDLLTRYENDLAKRVETRSEYDTLSYPYYIKNLLEDLVLIKRYEMLSQTHLSYS